ncbi:VIT1/CCC1 transporter family protein [Haloplasma contractile]|uniref:VIT domain containing protein n=1 Tax=Haloplasma contractile SSD-17B TaxID=1033810 RepID=U2DXP3_9MOLU|nr:VIT1/CCC1 transporter family protein [Haloplasma contractile]ERJ13017.1 VIT domain containing protein [Haloplasma contractile SSD-17B]
MKDNKELIRLQKKEITDHYIYRKLAKRNKYETNRKILNQICEAEARHYEELRAKTQIDVIPNKIKVFLYYWICVLFGLTFGLKLLEKDEEKAQKKYEPLCSDHPFIEQIFDEELEGIELINKLNEERLNYAGSVVLGLNDALVELTGALAGYTFAFKDTNIIAIIGLITGVSASFSMAASEYLSTKQEEGENALKASIYTGIAYISTVLLLVTPFIIFSVKYTCLAVSLITAVFIIIVFNYYISVAKDYNFKKRFIEMTFISLGVATISFVFGVIIKLVFGLEV